jgi:hypothetical protein
MHRHHAWVHESTYATKLRVDKATVPQAILADVVPLPGAHWLDNRSLLQGPSSGTKRECRVLQNLN